MDVGIHAALPACLPACRPACRPASRLAGLPACLPSCSLACHPACLPACLPSYHLLHGTAVQSMTHVVPLDCHSNGIQTAFKPHGTLQQE
eukprot:351729-Chlamydomonas_euryale.AAC.7